MPRSSHPLAAPARMASYRQHMRATGLRPVQIWVPDARAPGFVDICHGQARAVAAHDSGGEEIMRWIEGVADWPKA